MMPIDNSFKKCLRNILYGAEEEIKDGLNKIMKKFVVQIGSNLF